MHPTIAKDSGFRMSASAGSGSGGHQVGQFQKARGLTDAIAERRMQLVLQSDGLNEASLWAGLADFDADTA